MNSEALRQFVRVSFFLVGGLIFLPGCFDSKRDIDVEQPLQINHEKHFRYFFDGTHKAENLVFHKVEEEEAPAELLEGNCLDCHKRSELLKEDNKKCGGCHLIFQDENARKDRTQRSCLGCHRTAWTGYRASIPTIEVCKSCHNEEPLTTSKHEETLRNYIKQDEAIPWIQINTIADHVRFSHVAHIRFADIACKDCHPQDMRKQSKAPDQVFVISMNDCIDCHQERQVNTDCLACHK